MKIKNHFFRFQIQPITILLISFIVAIISYILSNIFFIIVFIILILIYLYKPNLKFLILTALIIISSVFGFLRTYLIDKKYNKIIKNIENKNIDIYGLIYFKEKNNLAKYFKNKIYIKLDKIFIKENKEYINLNYLIKISYPDKKLININSGDYVKIKNLKINKINKNKIFLIAQNSLPNLLLEDINFKIKKNINLIKYIWSKIALTRQNLIERLNKKLSRNTKDLFNYIFLGLQRNSEFSDNIKKHMLYWGISHYLARSGLHLVLILFLLTFLFKFIPLKYNFKKLILFFIILIYYFLTIKSVSFNRAFLTILIYNLCDLRKIAINNIHVISLVCFLSLLSNPYKLTLLDFQLSFILTFVLCHIQELNLNIKICSKYNS